MGINAGGGAGIKSVQRGVIAIAPGDYQATATIAAVDTNKAKVEFLGSDTNGTSAGVGYMGKLMLASATQVTATRNGSNGAPTFYSYVAFQVTDYS